MIDPFIIWVTMWTQMYHLVDGVQKKRVSTVKHNKPALLGLTVWMLSNHN